MAAVLRRADRGGRPPPPTRLRRADPGGARPPDGAVGTGRPQQLGRPAAESRGRRGRCDRDRRMHPPHRHGLERRVHRPSGPLGQGVRPGGRLRRDRSGAAAPAGAPRDRGRHGTERAIAPHGRSTRSRTEVGGPRCAQPRPRGSHRALLRPPPLRGRDRPPHELKEPCVADRRWQQRSRDACARPRRHVPMRLPAPSFFPAGGAAHEWVAGRRGTRADPSRDRAQRPPASRGRRARRYSPDGAFEAREGR